MKKFYLLTLLAISSLLGFSQITHTITNTDFGSVAIGDSSIREITFTLAPESAGDYNITGFDLFTSRLPWTEPYYRGVCSKPNIKPYYILNNEEEIINGASNKTLSPGESVTYQIVFFPNTFTYYNETTEHICFEFDPEFNCVFWDEIPICTPTTSNGQGDYETSIQYRTIDNNDKSTFSESILITGTGVEANTVGLNSTNETGLSLYPNPTEGLINIEGAQAGDAYQVINSFGETIISGNYSNEGIDLSSLSSQIVLLRINNSDFKVIIK